jgi:hypothetical protein
MLASVAASAAAARAIGYPGLGDLIEVNELGSERVVALLRRISFSRAASKDCAVIILAASIGRYRACPLDWSPEPEQGLALALLEDLNDPEAQYRKLSDRAARLVKDHWAEIAGQLGA